jgi:hypothetical protein
MRFDIVVQTMKVLLKLETEVEPIVKPLLGWETAV